MTTSDIINCRLINQHIATTSFKRPQEIVSWLVAMQAQEFAMAKWAIGLRLPGFNDADIEKLFNDGEILRTHLMRPTWHFVTPLDIRWMLSLTAPRVNAVNAYWYRKFELDPATFKRSNHMLVKTLEGGKQLTRATLKSALEQAKIFADGLRLGYLLMRAELDGIVCSGARQGKQFTYALLEERVPPARRLHHEEALAEFTQRYFASRGPATLQDFVYWSGLTMKEAKAGAASLKPEFVHEIIDDQDYIFGPSASKNLNSSRADVDDKGGKKAAFPAGRLQTTFLMPDYDEYGMSYKNRSVLFSSPSGKTGSKKLTLENPEKSSAYDHMIVIDGRIAGTWNRTIKNNTIFIETTSFYSLSKSKHQEVLNAVKRYSSFVGKDFEEVNHKK